MLKSYKNDCSAAKRILIDHASAVGVQGVVRHSLGTLEFSMPPISWFAAQIHDRNYLDITLVLTINNSKGESVN